MPAPCLRTGAPVAIRVDVGPDIRAGSVVFQALESSFSYRVPLGFERQSQDGGLLRAGLPAPLFPAELRYRLELSRRDYRSVTSRTFRVPIRDDCPQPSLPDDMPVPVALEADAPTSPPGFKARGRQIGEQEDMTQVSTPSVAQTERSKKLLWAAGAVGAGAGAAALVATHRVGTAGFPVSVQESNTIPREGDVSVEGIIPCFVQRIPAGSCRMRFDASCSTSDAPIDQTVWFFDVTEEVGSTFMQEGVMVNVDFSGCDGDWIFVRLRLVSQGRVASETFQVRLPIGLN